MIYHVLRTANRERRYPVNPAEDLFLQLKEN
jgi:hypothetical protein